MLNNKTKSNYVFSIFARLNPKPTTELKYNSNFELLIAVVLSAHTTDISVNKATNVLFNKANTPEKILELNLSALEKYIKVVGLYKTKARNIINICSILINDYSSEIPDNYDSLIKLPGVGRKTANVILNTLFNKKVIAVDTHVFRVSNRMGITTSNNIINTEKQLNDVISEEYKLNAHNWLVLHGRYICKAKKPLCDLCPVNEFCDYYLSTM